MQFVKQGWFVESLTVYLLTEQFSKAGYFFLFLFRACTSF